MPESMAELGHCIDFFGTNMDVPRSCNILNWIIEVPYPCRKPKGSKIDASISKY